jgi:hypothetical protein
MSVFNLKTAKALDLTVAIAVPSLDKMPLVINILITAVRNGELDQQLAQTKKPATVPKYLDKTVNNLITMIETMTDISRVESQGAV